MKPALNCLIPLSSALWLTMVVVKCPLWYDCGLYLKWCSHRTSAINLGGKTLKIWYPTRPKTCCNCGSGDHMVKDCNSMCCHSCECPSHQLGTICKSNKHQLNECPFAVYSASEKKVLYTVVWQALPQCILSQWKQIAPLYLASDDQVMFAGNGLNKLISWDT